MNSTNWMVRGGVKKREVTLEEMGVDLGGDRESRVDKIHSPYLPAETGIAGRYPHTLSCSHSASVPCTLGLRE